MFDWLKRIFRRRRTSEDLDDIITAMVINRCITTGKPALARVLPDGTVEIVDIEAEEDNIDA